MILKKCAILQIVSKKFRNVNGTAYSYINNKANSSRIFPRNDLGLKPHSWLNIDFQLIPIILTLGPWENVANFLQCCFGRLSVSHRYEQLRLNVDWYPGISALPHYRLSEDGQLCFRLSAQQAVLSFKSIFYGQRCYDFFHFGDLRRKRSFWYRVSQK